MPTIIDHVKCEACDGEGEIRNESFLALDPLKRLEMINDPNFELDEQDLSKPMMKCPFCEEGQAPIYECEACSGEGTLEDGNDVKCGKCEGQGWYQ